VPKISRGITKVKSRHCILVLGIMAGVLSFAAEEIVTAAVTHPHGIGACQGTLKVTPTRFSYASTTAQAGVDHSFSTPQDNIRSYEFLDNADKHDSREAKGYVLYLKKWRLENGIPGNNGTFFFSRKEDFEEAHRLMDHVHKPKSHGQSK
jgi:hypothetical protein